MKIKAEDRFTEMEMFRMFNVDIAPNVPLHKGERNRPIEAQPSDRGSVLSE